MQDAADLPGAEVLESAMDGMAVLEGDEYVYVNEAHATLYGYDDPDELVGQTWQQLYDDDQIERFETEILPIVREEGEWRGRAIGRTRDGERFEQELSLSRTGSEGLVCVVRDVSARAEQRRRLERQEVILGSIRDGVYTLDPDGVITWVNAAAVDEFDAGYTRDELIGAHVSMLMSDADIERCAVLIEELLTDPDAESRRCEVDLLPAAGDPIPCELNITLLPTEDGEFQGTVGVIRDVTERKQREQQLSVLNRLLRHNLRNRLTVLLGHLDLHEDTGEATHLEEVRETAEEVLAVSDKARRLEELVEAAESSAKEVDVVQVVESCTEQYRSAYPHASIVVDAPDTQSVRADDRLGVAIGELIENAIEHADGDPTVTVRVKPPESPSGTVSVVVADDGPGIPEAEIAVLDADRERPLSHGSGLGLWYLRWYADRRGAGLSFTEADDDGTVVTLELLPG